MGNLQSNRKRSVRGSVIMRKTNNLFATVPLLAGFCSSCVVFQGLYKNKGLQKF